MNNKIMLLHSLIILALAVAFSAVRCTGEMGPSGGLELWVPETTTTRSDGGSK